MLHEVGIIMNQQKTNTWLSTDSKELIEYYMNSAEVIVVERERSIKLLVDIFSYHFKERSNLRVLDLGCGDGIITKSFCDKYPDHHYFLIDGSEDMIERAKEKLRGVKNITFIHQSFDEFTDTEGAMITYDFIFSSNAIHHLDAIGKAKLYFKIYLTLNTAGLFINYDVVQPASERSEQWQFNMWRQWMNQILIKKGLSDDVGKHDGLPDLYKSKQDNHPGSLIEQLQILEKIGFKDVDCFFKYGIFALFGGIK
jgi:tRNA (cmo5U34)-methyltransferase